MKAPKFSSSLSDELFQMLQAAVKEYESLGARYDATGDDFLWLANTYNSSDVPSIDSEDFERIKILAGVIKKCKATLKKEGK